MISVLHDDLYWVYITPLHHSRDGKTAFLELQYHYIAPNDVDNMSNKSEQKLEILSYNGENTRWNFL